MKTWEAIKAAEEGKRIRRKCWTDDEYSFKDEGARFGKPALITHLGWQTSIRGFNETVILEHLGWDAIFADDWEIYEEEENERTSKSFAKWNMASFQG